jgi:ATP-binding cassette subfamily B protein
MRTLIGYVHLLLSTWVAKQVHSHLSERTFGRVLIEEPMTQIYRRSIGYYLTLAGDDTFRAGTIVLSTSQSVANLTSVFVGFLLLYIFSPIVFLWMMVFMLLCALAVGVAFGALLLANEQSVKMSAGARTTYVEALNGLRSIRSMAAESFIAHTYSEQIRQYVRLLFKIEAIRAGMKFLPASLALFAGALALWPGTTRIEGLTAGYFFAATTLLIRIFVSLGSFINSVTLLFSDLRAATDIAALTGYKPAVRVGKVQTVGAARIESVELTDICYGYHLNQDVLCGLNMLLERGRIIAVVGPSGSGKSTLADLLLGLVQAKSGIIMVNSGTIPSSELSRYVVLVEQQARIFTTSVRENVLLGASVDDNRIWEVLRLVDLESYVRVLPYGLDSEFEYQGSNLSGGQRQRLSIARALVRQPQVLILDEATSALDPVTRDLVMSRVKGAMSNGIIMMITHDESLTAIADSVVALKPFTRFEAPLT